MLLIAAALSLSCTTKVSEWFLLNAVPDNYILVYHYKNSIPESVLQQNRELEKIANASNYIFKSALKENIVNPYYALYYNNRVFSEYSDYSSINGLAISPFRENIVSELMEGKLCVLLYLSSGNQEKDEQGLQVVNNTIALSPFKNIISVMKLDRSNENEKHLISMLLNVEVDLKDIDEPMLFGIFGRFRVLEPLLAKGISKENINLLIDFLSADCSCLIKDNLPGISILCNADWDNPKPAMVNTITESNSNLSH